MRACPCWCELEQRFECWPFVLEFEQFFWECEREYRRADSYWIDRNYLASYNPHPLVKIHHKEQGLVGYFETP